MSTVNEIYSFINSIIPFDTQESWDNSGLLVGDKDAQVQKVALALDITPETVKNAADFGAELFISHHPVIFNPAKTVLSYTALHSLIKNGMAAICAHTCLDSADGGVNDVLCSLLGFENTEPLPLPSTKVPMARLAHIKPCTAKELAKHVCNSLGCHLRLADGGNTIGTVAVCGGACSSLADEVFESADAFITGEVSHHTFLDAVEKSKTIIAAGHYETENPVVSAVCKKLQARFPETEFKIVAQQNPVVYY